MATKGFVGTVEGFSKSELVVRLASGEIRRIFLSGTTSTAVAKAEGLTDLTQLVGRSVRVSADESEFFFFESTVPESQKQDYKGPAKLKQSPNEQGLNFEAGTKKTAEQFNGGFVTLIQGPDSVMIQLTEDGKAFLTDARSEDDHGEVYWAPDWDTVFTGLLEPLVVDSDWEILHPEEVGGLTSAPILGYDTQRDDSTNDLLHVGHVYWYPDYQVLDPLDVLYTEGEVVFPEAPEDKTPEEAHEASRRAKSKDNWMQEAMPEKTSGALHKALGVSKDHKFTIAELEGHKKKLSQKAKKGKLTKAELHLEKMLVSAINAMRSKKGSLRKKATDWEYYQGDGENGPFGYKGGWFVEWAPGKDGKLGYILTPEDDGEPPMTDADVEIFVDAWLDAQYAAEYSKPLQDIFEAMSPAVREASKRISEMPMGDDGSRNLVEGSGGVFEVIRDEDCVIEIFDVDNLKASGKTDQEIDKTLDLMLQWAQNNQGAIVTVVGGVPEVYYAPEGVSVTIIDHDNDGTPKQGSSRRAEAETPTAEYPNYESHNERVQLILQENFEKEETGERTDATGRSVSVFDYTNTAKQLAEQYAEEDDWSEFLETFQDMLNDLNPQDLEWHVEGTNLNWRGSSGSMDLSTNNAENLLRKVSPKTDCHYRAYQGEAGFKLIIYSHDVPMGSVLLFTLKGTEDLTDHEGSMGKQRVRVSKVRKGIVDVSNLDKLVTRGRSTASSHFQIAVVDPEGQDHYDAVLQAIKEVVLVQKKADPQGYLDAIDSSFPTLCLEVADSLGAQFREEGDGTCIFDFSKAGSPRPWISGQKKGGLFLRSFQTLEALVHSQPSNSTYFVDGEGLTGIPNAQGKVLWYRWTADGYSLAGSTDTPEGAQKRTLPLREAKRGTPEGIGLGKGSYEDILKALHEKGDTDDPEALAAWIFHKNTGHWPGEKANRPRKKKGSEQGITGVASRVFQGEDRSVVYKRRDLGYKTSSQYGRNDFNPAHTERPHFFQIVKDFLDKHPGYAAWAAVQALEEIEREDDAGRDFPTDEDLGGYGFHPGEGQELIDAYVKYKQENSPDPREPGISSEEATQRYEFLGLSRSDAQGAREADVMSGRVPPDPNDPFEVNLASGKYRRPKGGFKAKTGIASDTFGRDKKRAGQETREIPPSELVPGMKLEHKGAFYTVKKVRPVDYGKDEKYFQVFFTDRDSSLLFTPRLNVRIQASTRTAFYDEGARDERPACPMCDGPGNFLGALGNRAHFRCENCGTDFSHLVEPTPEAYDVSNPPRRTKNQSRALNRGGGKGPKGGSYLDSWQHYAGPPIWTSAEEAGQWLAEIKAKVKAPYVGGYVSSLGGDRRSSVLLTISGESREKWHNGILENSPFAKIHLTYDGELSPIVSSAKWRKVHISTVAQAIAKLQILANRLVYLGSGTQVQPSRGASYKPAEGCKTSGQKSYSVIVSPSMKAFWSNQYGWVKFVEDATKFPFTSSDLNEIPPTEDGDAQWMPLEQAEKLVFSPKDADVRKPRNQEAWEEYADELPYPTHMATHKRAQRERLGVLPDGMLVYSYETEGGEMAFKFHLLSEVGAPYQKWFEEEIKRRGWTVESRDLPKAPWRADFVVRGWKGGGHESAFRGQSPHKAARPVGYTPAEMHAFGFSDSDIELLLTYHGGQSSALYSVGSRLYSFLMDLEQGQKPEIEPFTVTDIQDAIQELNQHRAWLRAHPGEQDSGSEEELDYLIGKLQKIKTVPDSEHVTAGTSSPKDPAFEKWLTDAPEAVMLDTLEYWAHRKALWNLKKISLTEAEIRKMIVAQRVFLHRGLHEAYQQKVQEYLAEETSSSARNAGGPKYISAQFTVPGLDLGTGVRGWYDPSQTWNGFACPVFAWEAAQRIAQAYSLSLVEDLEEGGKAYYDAVQDAFVFPGDDVYKGQDTVTGSANESISHVYPVGACGWAWEPVGSNQ